MCVMHREYLTEFQPGEGLVYVYGYAGECVIGIYLHE